MFEFKVIKKSKKTKARIGILKTGHGEVETPAFVTVATNAVVKALTSEEVKETKTQIAIANTFHLHLRPGEDIVKKNGGLHKFMNWDKPLMTDSAGFQVFSLGFGSDLKVGKKLKYSPGKDDPIVDANDQPQKIKIFYEGVKFQSPHDGSEVFIGPKESIKIQEALGADIIFAFDECTPPLLTYKYARLALERTHRWAKVCLEVKKSRQALFGIIQGSKFKDLRIESAKNINSLGFEGYGVGGDLGTSKKDTENVLNWTLPYLDERKPRHLLGIGYPEDMELIIRNGVDLFDCTVPTHYARHGVAFINGERVDLRKKRFLKDKNLLDERCSCCVCRNYTRSYLSHLVRAREITGLRLLTFHNLFFFNTYVEKIRERIKSGKV
jgi:queuine tRNA-ribosyltransferase/7-cyano-7-deazaguanine tRNA-ribosyltransferase